MPAAVAAAAPDGGEEWPADLEWAQIPNPYGRTVTRDPEVHIARTARDRSKTSEADKAEARADSARASRIEAVEATRAEVRQCKEEAAEVSKVEEVEASKAEDPQCRAEVAEM